MSGRVSRMLNAAFHQMSQGTAREKEEPTVNQEQAAARLAALQRDAVFRERMFSGDADARSEWSSLIHIAAGQASPTGTPQVQAQKRIQALTNDPAWRTRYLGGDPSARDEMRALTAHLAAEPEGDTP
jgi:hypothetical protein